MAQCPTPVDPDTLAQQMGDLPRAADRLRLVGLDHAVRVQQARLGATSRRLALVQARRPENGGEIARLETAVTVETEAQRSFTLAVSTAEIEVPARTAGTAVIHGRVVGEDGAPAAGLTVAAIEASGNVRRFACTDDKGYFSMSLPIAEGQAAPVFLQVSDPDQAVLYRGDEAIPLADGGVTFRLIQLGAGRRPTCPQPPDRAVMPDLLDQPETAALATLGRLGLTLGQRLTQRDPQRAGLVVSQTPAPGELIAGDTTVTLVIGAADQADTTAVPDVVGLSRDEAEARLREAKLEVGAISARPGDQPGAVLSQKPEAGVQVAPGTAISLVIAAPPRDDRVAVPDLRGRTQDEAGRLLDQVGLVLGAIELRDDPRAGLVLAQKPPPDTPAAKGSSVDLVIGREAEPERTAVPALAGSTLSQARAALERARLQLGEVSGPRNGRVAEQKPVPGDTVPVGSTVAISLASGGGAGGGGGGRGGDVAPVDGRVTADFGSRFADSIVGDPDFAALGADPDVARAGLADLADRNAVRELVTRPESELQAVFGLKNRKQARDFRRMLRAGLKRL